MNNLFLSETISPLSQFEIREILSLKLTIQNLFVLYIDLTTIGLYLTISLIFILVMSILSVNFNKIVSNHWSISLDILFFTVLKIVVDQINGKEGQRYFPLVYTLFIFILINNLMGLVPYSFSTTAHLAVVLSMSFTVVLGSLILGLLNNGLKFFSLFVPSGTPLALLPLLVIIEFISYLARPISLGLRLGANIESEFGLHSCCVK